MSISYLPVVRPQTLDPRSSRHRFLFDKLVAYLDTSYLYINIPISSVIIVINIEVLLCFVLVSHLRCALLASPSLPSPNIAPNFYTSYNSHSASLSRHIRHNLCMCARILYTSRSTFRRFRAKRRLLPRSDDQ